MSCPLPTSVAEAMTAPWLLKGLRVQVLCVARFSFGGRLEGLSH